MVDQRHRRPEARLPHAQDVLLVRTHQDRDGARVALADQAGHLDAAQSRLSFHLKTLREAGLVTDRREGRWVYYELVPEILTALAGALTALTTPGGAKRKTWWACCE